MPKKLKQWRKGKPGSAVIETGSAAIEITTYCNLSCLYCPRRFEVLEEKNMTAKEFDYVLNQLLRCSSFDIKHTSLALSGFGEPFMNPHFMDMVRNPLLKKFHLVNFSTNATLLTEKNIKELIDSEGVSFVNVSLQSSIKKVMEYLQGEAEFEATVKNVKSLLDYADKKKPKTRIRIQHLKTTLNPNETKEDFEKLLGVKMTSREKDYHIGREILFRSKTMTAGAIGKKTLESHPDFKRSLVKWRIPDPDKPYYCKGIYGYNWIINVHGDLTACCHDSTRDQTYGNIFDTPLATLRSSKLLQELRTELRNKNFSRLPLCEKCLSLR